MCSFLVPLHWNVKFRCEVESIGITTKAFRNGPQGGFHLFVPLSGTGRPQDFHSVANAGDGGHTVAIHLKASTSQEFILKVDNHIVLITVFSLGGLYLGHLEVLVDIVALLTNGFDNGILKEFLILTRNILKTNTRL
jgi:hypothetical protein